MNSPLNLHSAYAALREENDILRETVRQLRQKLAPQIAYPSAWAFSRQHGIVLSCLMAASPGVATHERITAALYGFGDQPDDPSKTIQVLMWKIRTRLRAAGADARIQSVLHVGYRMAVADRDRLQAIMSRADAGVSVTARRRVAEAESTFPKQGYSR